MHYLGGNYTALHRNINNIIWHIYAYVDGNLLQHYRHVKTTGCLNVFNASCSWKNFMTYWGLGNNPSITKKLNAVMKTMNKKECNNFIIPLPSWIAQYKPHIFLHHNTTSSRKDGKLPQRRMEHFLMEGWKNWLIFYAAKWPTKDAIPINLMTFTKDRTELSCTFGTVMADFLTHLWNLRITFPNCNIAIPANNAKLCFRQLKHHPNTMGAFSFVIDTIPFYNTASLLVWTSVLPIGSQTG